MTFQVNMVDIVDKVTRSRMMGRIRSKNTGPELRLRRALHALGFRYRLHKRMAGRPDMVFAKHRTAVFVHGCFWHRHQSCRYATSPATRPEFWQAKFAANVARDSAAIAALHSAGWRVVVVWECALRGRIAPDEAADTLAAWMRGGDTFLELGSQSSK